MDNFITWNILVEFASFLSVLYVLVEFTKELPGIKNIPTKYWSALVCFILLTIVNIHNGTFLVWDLVIYALSSVMISLTGNGLANFNKDKQQ